MCKPHCYPERNWIQFLILRLLYEKPTYGYELREKLETITCGCQRHEAGVIYTTLRRMEEKGIVSSRWERKEEGPDRRVYTVTKEGKEVLKEGLRMYVERRRLFADLVNFYQKNFEGGEKYV
jgi:PadR family transcriptional regulator PadR